MIFFSILSLFTCRFLLRIELLRTIVLSHFYLNNQLIVGLTIDTKILFFLVMLFLLLLLILEREIKLHWMCETIVAVL